MISFLLCALVFARDGKSGDNRYDKGSLPLD